MSCKYTVEIKKTLVQGSINFIFEILTFLILILIGSVCLTFKQ